MEVARTSVMVTYPDKSATPKAAAIMVTRSAWAVESIPAGIPPNSKYQLDVDTLEADPRTVPEQKKRFGSP